MTQDIAATGFVGWAFETGGAGVYAAPTKFAPLEGEGLKYANSDKTRRLIRGVADSLGQLAGPFHVEGDLTFEALPDVVPYFLYASRNTVVKTGTNPFVYVGTPQHGALPNTGRTLSITIVKSGIAMGYVGCVVSQLSFTGEDGVLKFTASVIGRDEANQSVPAYVGTNQAPFTHGMYTMGSPTGTTVLDVDSWTFAVNDNAKPNNRYTNTRAATFVNFGEREATLQMSRDFINRTEYDEFKAVTARSVRVQADNGASAQIRLTMTVSTKDDYTIDGLSGQGDLIMASMTYRGHYDTAVSKAYEISVTTTENVT